MPGRRRSVNSLPNTPIWCWRGTPPLRGAWPGGAARKSGAGPPAKTEWGNYAPGSELAANRIGSPAEATPEQVVIGSVREGMVPGIHTVTYESEDDILELKHTIKNRRTLAMGAVIAAEFLCGKQGVYSMDDLLK